MNWTGYYWMTEQNSFGWERRAGWYSCPATENHKSKQDALEAAHKFGNVAVAYNTETGEGRDFAKGFMQAYKLAKGDTYMYDSSRRVQELQQRDTNENPSEQYQAGFLSGVYSLFRC